jgi:hypothetical protein
MAAALVAVAVAVAVLRTQQDRSRDFLHNPIKILSALRCVKFVGFTHPTMLHSSSISKPRPASSPIQTRKTASTLQNV